MEIKNLDFFLRNALINLKDSKNKRKGVVAAALIDADKFEYSTSEKIKGMIYIHAERNALNHYLKKYGVPSKNSVMIISLSPCIKDSVSRDGKSCSSLLLGEDKDFFNSRIKRVHVGLIDPSQENEEFYKSLGFDLSVTSDKNLQNMCKNLYDYFLPENYGKISTFNYVQKTLSNLK